MALTTVFTQVTLASSVQDLVHQGNKFYDKGNFNEALKEYDQAIIDQPQALVPKFNKANCYFQLDDLTKAIDIYNEVAAYSKDMELVAKAKYNLGNSYFQRGSKQKDSNLQKALEDLQTSIVYWRSALEINPQNEKAAKNIEVARLIIKDIIDQINKQKKEQQQQAGKQKQLQEQLKKIAEQQKALAQKTQQTKNDANEGRISRQEAENNYQKQAQEQSQLKAKTEQALQQIQQQDPNSPQPPQMQQAGSQLEQAVDAQSDAEKQLKASDGNTAEQSQDKAAEHLENALKALSGDNQQNQRQQQKQQEQTQQPQEPNQPDHEQQQKEQRSVAAPDATAQEILDKEQQEKKQRQILQQGGYQKVEKDW
jgi:tetratricopeptide (TPR) repeat protein